MVDGRRMFALRRVDFPAHRSLPLPPRVSDATSTRPTRLPLRIPWKRSKLAPATPRIKIKLCFFLNLFIYRQYFDYKPSFPSSWASKTLKLESGVSK